MNSVNEILPILTTLIQGLAKHFGEGCEFVLHDYTKDASSIVAIANGQVTGRAVGNGERRIGLRIMPGKEEEDGRYNYVTQTQDGRFLRSSTIHLRDDSGKVMGALCVNFDITELISSRNFLDRFIKMNPASFQQDPADAVFFDNVEDLLVAMIADSINYVGVPVAHMTREHKIEGINYLNRRGAFKIKNAASVVAKYYDISRYTIYNYINDGESKELS